MRQHVYLTYGNSQETEVDDRLREFLGAFFPGEVHPSSVPRDDTSLDDVIADSLMKRHINAGVNTEQH